MNIKKHLIYFVFILTIFSSSLIMMSFKENYHQRSTSKLVRSIAEDDPVYFWFFVKVRIDTKSNIYKIAGSGGGINHGYLYDFEKSLWKGLSRRQIAIGPFQSREEALNSIRLYKADKSKINELPEGDVPTRAHWFAITFKQSDRQKFFILERAPGSVNTGTMDNFIDAFFAQLEYKFLQIGPFYSYEQAEEAKRLYRKNE